MPSFFITALDEPTYKELNDKLEKWWPQNMIHNNDNDNESSCQSVKLSVCQSISRSVSQSVTQAKLIALSAFAAGLLRYNTYRANGIIKT